MGFVNLGFRDIRGRALVVAGAAVLLVAAALAAGVPGHPASHGGTVFVTRGWSASAHGFDVDATAGAAALTVTTP